MKDPVRLGANVALVTGGGRGIGRAVALAFAQAGVDVAVASRTSAELEDVAAHVKRAGAKALAIRTDVTDGEQVERMVAQTESGLGPIDIFVNNAGLFLHSPLLATSEQDWDNTIAVNLKAAFLCCKAVLARMAQRKRGKIVIISSLAGKKPYPQQAAYCASKHGLEGFAKVLAVEAQPHNVSVHVVSPGGVDTRLTRTERDDVDFSKWMHPDEVAEAVLYLCSQQGIATTDEIILRRREAPPWTH